MKLIPSGSLLRLLAFLAVITFVSGCSTTKKPDWDSRIGSYTYDQAIADMGPPDKQAKLSDGRTVAEWISRRSGGGLSIGTGFSTGHAGVGVGQSIGSGREHSLRLTFGLDGRLSDWRDDR